MKKYEVTLRFSNSAPNALTFILEPWGEVYDFAAGSEMVVQFSADRAGEPEVVLGPGTIEVYGWTGCTFTLLRDGAEPQQVDTTVASGWTQIATTSLDAQQKPNAKKSAPSARRRAS